jgi:hypothetical protein
MPAHKVGDLLAQTREFRMLSHHARRLAEVQQVLLEAVPLPLAGAIRVGSFQTGTLLILAANSAVAAKLRQLTPSLLFHVRKREIQVTGIRVEVQVRKQQKACLDKPVRDLSRKTVDDLDRLADSLRDSPLKAAISLMVQRHKSVRGGTES